MSLIPWTEMLKVIDQPKRGMRRREVVLTLPDGSKVTKIMPMPKN